MKQRHKTDRRGAFTLVELMVVIVIIGLLAGLVGQQVMKNVAKAKIATARTQMAQFSGAVKQYRLDTDQYPDNSMGLMALLEEPAGVNGWDPHGYLENVNQVPLDPWGNEYIYYYTGEPRQPFEIISMGPDGEEGTEDDISSLGEATAEAEVY